MTFFEQFFSNTIFLTAAFGWLVAQILKTLIHLIVSKKFVAERLVGSGGMPSSHSATVCALVTAVCYEYGAGSFEFAISLILAIIVMYDAMGVRRETGIQAQVLNLMEQLQEQMGLTYLFISHDLSVVKHISDEIAVMYLGNIVEVIPGEDVTEYAVHPYTQALLGAQFSIHMDPSQKIQSIESEAPSPLDVPKGCPFQNRCENCTDRCKAEMPKLKEIAPGHAVACFYVEEQKI